MALRLRDEVLDAAYELFRAQDGEVVVWRRSSDGGVAELCRTAPRAHDAGRLILAEAILADALLDPPARKLVRDYSRFLPAPAEESVTIAARDVQAWVLTWEPPLGTMFRRLP